MTKPDVVACAFGRSICPVHSIITRKKITFELGGTLHPIQRGLKCISFEIQKTLTDKI